VDGLGAARRDEDLVGPERDVVLREIAGDGLPQLEKALGRPVGEDGLAPLVERVHHGPRGGNVGIADVEVEDLDPPGFGLVGVGLEFPDRGCLDIVPALGDVHGSILRGYRMRPLGVIIEEKTEGKQRPSQSSEGEADDELVDGVAEPQAPNGSHSPLAASGGSRSGRSPISRLPKE